MQSNKNGSRKPSLIWVSTITPASSLDSTTWLDTSNELCRLGWQVVLIGKGESTVQQVGDVEVRCMNQPEIYFFGQWIFHFHILKYLLQQWSETDIILFHQVSALWMLPLRFVRLLRRQKRPLLVMDTRDLNTRDGGFKTRLRVWFFDLMYKLAGRWADGQTAITPRMAELVNITPEQLWGIWPSGVYIDRFAAAQTGRQWTLANNSVHLMYVGKLHHGRNPLLLCQAVERANAEGMSFILSLVGSGPEQAVLEEFAQQTGGRVRICPPVPHAQVPDMLRQAHVGVTSLPPSNDRKFAASSPIKLFEYLAAGMPILSTRNVCHTDVIGGEAFAFWADDANVDDLVTALRSVWEVRHELQELGEAGYDMAQAWTWQEAGMKLSNALEYGMSLTT